MTTQRGTVCTQGGLCDWKVNGKGVEPSSHNHEGIPKYLVRHASFTNRGDAIKLCLKLEYHNGGLL